MALHIPDLIYDFEPSHGYWCFAYECLNGFLSDIPNNNQNIELQIINKFLQQFSLQVVDTDIDSVTKGEVSMITKCSESESYTSFSDSLLLISNLLKPPAGGLSKFDIHLHEDGFQFQIKLDRGDVLNWSIELLHPSQLRVRVSDEFVVELQEHFRMLYSTDVSVLPLIDKFGRCLVNGQKFSSEYNSTDRGSVVKSMIALKYSSLLWGGSVVFQSIFYIAISMRLIKL